MLTDNSCNKPPEPATTSQPEAPVTTNMHREGTDQPDGVTVGGDTPKPKDIEKPDVEAEGPLPTTLLVVIVVCATIVLLGIIVGLVCVMKNKGTAQKDVKVFYPATTAIDSRGSSGWTESTDYSCSSSDVYDNITSCSSHNIQPYTYTRAQTQSTEPGGSPISATLADIGDSGLGNSVPYTSLNTPTASTHARNET